MPGMHSAQPLHNRPTSHVPSAPACPCPSCAHSPWPTQTSAVVRAWLPACLQGVIPSSPDAWVWLGDFAYMDDPLINCNSVPSYPQCNCSATWLQRPPFGCFAGVAEHARLRVQLQVRWLGRTGHAIAVAWGWLLIGVAAQQLQRNAVWTRQRHQPPKPLACTFVSH